MAGRVAVVTGAARGLGAAVARALAAEGWRLVLTDVCADDPAVPYPLARPEELVGLAAELDAEAVTADVRQPDQLATAVARAVERHGGLDAAVAGHGVIAGGPPAWETDPAVWDAVVGVDLTGVFHLARAAVPALLARPAPRQGRFVAVASAAGLVGLPRLAAYTAAKHGVVGFVRGLAADLAGTGVTANAVCPGSMRTAMLDASAAVYGLADVEELAVHHLTGTLLDPAEVAAFVTWLCSPASSALTGAALPADAGLTTR
jgi:SDR family mycofactocin-dependent oxidoreductase